MKEFFADIYVHLGRLPFPGILPNNLTIFFGKHRLKGHCSWAIAHTRGIATARRISVDTVGNMRQNLLFAFVYNAMEVPIAAGVLYPFLGILLSPMIAALAMSCSSVSVVSNALRLRKRSY